MPKKKLLCLLLIMVLPFIGCSPKVLKRPPEEKNKYDVPTQRPYVIKGIRYYPIASAKGYKEVGIASWYGRKFHGRKTSNGEIYNMYGNTVAHKTLPMNTRLRIKNLENDREIFVRVNDRGPFVDDRIIDLTYTGAKKLGMVEKGTAMVEITALGSSSKPARYSQKTKSTSRKQKTSESIKTDKIKEKFYIQVAIFEEKNQARGLAGKFAAKGRDVIIKKYPAAGTNLYKVLVLAGKTISKARNYEKYLKKNGFPNTAIIVR